MLVQQFNIFNKFYELNALLYFSLTQKLEVNLMLNKCIEYFPCIYDTGLYKKKKKKNANECPWDTG